MIRLWGLFLGVVLLPAQITPWYGLRAGLNWGQYLTKDQADIRSRAYWGGGFSGAIAAQVPLNDNKMWALQGELGTTQRRGTDRNLLSDYRYNLWSLDLTALGVWRWNRKFEVFMLETGPTSSLLVYGKYWQRDNLSGEVETRRVQYGVEVNVTFGGAKSPGHSVPTLLTSWGLATSLSAYASGTASITSAAASSSGGTTTAS
jgi:hypothetical protein